jgi:energy-coupling factor transport system ATP-binding protein
LAGDPALLVLDEPTSQLDDASAATALDAVAGLSAAGTAVIVSEHRLERLAGLATEQVHVAAGRACRGDEARGAARCGRVVPPRAPATATGSVLVEVDGLRFAYGAGAPLFRDFGFTVAAGEVVAITGPSGAGKTTLLRLLMGLATPAAGRCRLAGAQVAPGDIAAAARRAAYLPQDPGQLLFARTVRGELEATLRNHARRETAKGLEGLLAQLGLAEVAGAYPRDLSTGQRQRCALAALVVAGTRIWLLDEPTRGLDDAAIAALAELLHTAARAGGAVLVATHDRRLIAATHRTIAL